MSEGPTLSLPAGGRQPLLWAAAAYGGGILFGSQLWRPASWWATSTLFLAAAGAFFLRRRKRTSYALALAALFAAGALLIQICQHSVTSEILTLADGRELFITGHVTREDDWKEHGPNELRLVLDLETEEIATENGPQTVRGGTRISFYAKKTGPEPPLFRYGQRLQFPAKLFPPRNFRNPGAFDYRSYLFDKGIAAVGSAKADRVIVLPGFLGSRLEAWRVKVHRSIIAKIHALWPPREAALVDAMVVGEDAFITRDLRTQFQRTGTYHVLVVSGMNVGILAFAMFWALRRLRVSEIVSSVATVMLGIAYAFLTDVGAPIWRATLMLALYLGVRLLYRDRSMLNAIGAAALGLLMIHPDALVGASFQLTFLCVLLIAAVGVPLLERTSQPFLSGIRNLASTGYDFSLPPGVVQLRLDLRLMAQRLALLLGTRLPLKLIGGGVRFVLGTFELLVISAVMQVGLALPMVYYFHRATVVGLPANILVVPLTEIMMPAAVLAVAIGYVSLTLAKVPAFLAGAALEAITGGLRWLGGMRLADTRAATPGTIAIVATLLALILAMVLARRKRALAAGGLIALAACALWVCLVLPRPQVQRGTLEVTALDVGQGDSLLIVTPESRTLLVDSGGMPLWTHSQFDTGEQVVAPYLWSRGISRLDAVAVTHPHADHMGGMASILADFKPQELWIGFGASNREMDRLLQEAERRRTPVVIRQAGDSFEFGGVTIRVLAPANSLGSQTHRQNDDTLVMKLTYRQTSALLEGDAEKPTERLIAQEHPEADLLKVAHHGSASSTSLDLLAAVRPRFALISVGANNVYGHPRIEVLQRLTDFRVATYRTDLQGAVTFYLDGKTVSARTAALR